MVRSCKLLSGRQLHRTISRECVCAEEISIRPYIISPAKHLKTNKQANKLSQQMQVKQHREQDIILPK
jgi:hypothetical protein